MRQRLLSLLRRLLISHDCSTCASLRGHIHGLAEGMGIPVGVNERARLEIGDHAWLELTIVHLRLQGRFPEMPGAGVGVAN